ncbi:HlyD family secretion protein [Brevibacillus dissolubilis]|uniref:HlyD family secretion protein n=1 Tax=Brevibacillus dissolubilis TaxID=1844116 RepID=UPI001115BCB6|nr:biotin/lipoyl-binding protein [Brevibacillus dissolubilis]
MKKRIIPLLLVIAALGTGGTLMVMQGKDAVTMAAVEKSSILTADTVNVSFQGVGGKVTAIHVTEEQQVKKGDILMTLDPTDLDLQIAKLKTDILQQDVKIRQTKDAVQIGLSKVATQEQQAQLGVLAAQTAESLVNQGVRTEDLERQKLAVEASRQALELTQTTYDRTKALFDSGAVSQASLDTVTNQLEAAKNGLSQQQALLHKMQAGATAQERQQAQIQTEKAKTTMTQTTQARQDVENSAYNVELLQKQKDSMQVQLQTLEVQKQRLVLKAPSDGKVTRIMPKVGENAAVGAPVVMLESNQLYYNIYIEETQIGKVKPKQSVSGHVVALNKEIGGKVRYISAAPQYATMKMSREKGQADVSAFLVRIDVERTPELLPGMTVEVKMDETAD